MGKHRLLFPLDLFVLLFLVGALLGVQFSYDAALSGAVQRGIIVGVIVFFALAHGIWGWGMAYGAGILLLMAGTIYAAFFILQFSYQNYPETPAIIEQVGQITTLLPDQGISPGHPNAAATFFVSLIPLGAAVVFTRRSWLFKIFWALCALICLYALVLTFSRGAMVALVAAVFIGMIALGRNPLLRIIGVFGVAAGIALLALSNAGSEWMLSRLNLYQNSLYVASDYMFTGIGLGETFPLVYSRYGLLIQVPFLTYSHNLFLSAWMGQGLVGLVALLGLIITFYFFVFRVNHSSRPRRIFHAAWLAVTALLIHGLFDSRHYVESLWLMPVFLGMFGLAAATGRLSLSEVLEDEPQASTWYFPYRVAAVGLVVLVVGVVVFQDTIRAAWYSNQGAIAETHAELGEGLSDADREELVQAASNHYREAIAYDPAWANAQRRLGNLLVDEEQFAEAIPHLEYAYERQPNNPAAVKGLGLAYTWNGQTEEAAETFLLLDDPQAMAEELNTWAFWRATDEQQQPLLSAYAYETAIQMYPNSSNLVLYRVTAEAYEAAGQPDRARDWYQRILTIEPDDEQAQEALAQLAGV